jgi:hypothetical protein
MSLTERTARMFVPDWTDPGHHHRGAYRWGGILLLKVFLLAAFLVTDVSGVVVGVLAGLCALPIYYIVRHVLLYRATRPSGSHHLDLARHSARPRAHS